MHSLAEPPSAEGDQDQCEEAENRRFDGLERPEAVGGLIDGDEVIAMSAEPLHLLQRSLNWCGAGRPRWSDRARKVPVSYTHLTLPTKA